MLVIKVSEQYTTKKNSNGVSDLGAEYFALNTIKRQQKNTRDSNSTSARNNADER